MYIQDTGSIASATRVNERSNQSLGMKYASVGASHHGSTTSIRKAAAGAQGSVHVGPKSPSATLGKKRSTLAPTQVGSDELDQYVTEMEQEIQKLRESLKRAKGETKQMKLEGWGKPDGPWR